MYIVGLKLHPNEGNSPSHRVSDELTLVATGESDNCNLTNVISVQNRDEVG